MSTLYLFRTSSTSLRAIFMQQFRKSSGICLRGTPKTCTSVIQANCTSIHTTESYPQIELKKEKTVSKNSTETAKRAVKDTSYALVILGGISSIGVVLYILYKELLSKTGPTQVFGDALRKCRSNEELTVALGLPLEGYGETDSRGRRRHVSHLAYTDSHGRDAMRMKFYLKGSSGRTATVHIDSVIVERKISYRYIIVYLDTYPKRIIIVLDERSELDKPITELEPV